jgi:hypothetical protein
VDPTDVRKQTGSYGEALAMHSERFNDCLPKWKIALRQVADLSGWHFKTGYLPFSLLLNLFVVSTINLQPTFNSYAYDLLLLVDE